MGYFELLIIFLSLVIFCYIFREKNGIPTNWPFVGTLPAILKNVHRIHGFMIEVLGKSHRMSFFMKGPWFANMDMLLTTDPANVRYVMSQNFGNYPKGAKLREVLDVLGDSMASTDFTLWQYHRKLAQSFLNHPNFHNFLVKKTWDKVENVLIPFLDHVSTTHATKVDLQDLFARFMFDTNCIIIMDYDPKSLSINLTSNPPSNALDTIEETIFHRYFVPTWVWKCQRWLNVGIENKYKKAWQTLDNFIYKCISVRREKISKGRPCKNKENDEENTDLLLLYIEDEAQNPKGGGDCDDKFLRDMISSKLIAGRDTISVALTWFFYLLSMNPLVHSKIKKELDEVKVCRSNFKEVSNKLVYLHVALCETLRLYPPIAFEAKTPIKSDVLPSGHQVHPNMQVIFNLYAMARMNSIWGDDCSQFRPERWITKHGEIKHEPSYKFLTFNSGPRTCLGKDMAFTQMKIVAATIIQNYVIEVVNEHQVVPNISLILHIKYGLKAKISRS